jgi:Xaa-Pro aminopeptidase
MSGISSEFPFTNPGDNSKPFVAGVTFNVEPVIEFADRKIHMRLEDTVLITANGADNLTARAPVELDELYALINQSPLGSK